MRNRSLVFALVSVPIETPRSRGSLAGNHLCGVHEYGEGTYTTEGITKLCEALKESNVTVLKCAPPYQVFALVSAPIDTPSPSRGSLADNRLCGIDNGNQGTYTAEGITKLCDALKGSAVTSLECAAAL